MERTDTSRAALRRPKAPGSAAANDGRKAAPAAAPAAALAGLVAAGVALGAGELIAGVDDRLASPVEAVAGEVIDRVPRSVERFAIETFGTNDKLALVVGILAFSAVFGIILGVVSRRRPGVGALGLATFAAIGMLASAAGPQASLTAGLPSAFAGLVGVLCLRSLMARAPRRDASGTPTHNDGAAAPGAPTGSEAAMPKRGGVASRRAFLGMTAAVAAAGGPGGPRGRGRARRRPDGRRWPGAPQPLQRRRIARQRGAAVRGPPRPAASAGGDRCRGRRARRGPVRHAQRRLLPG